MNDYREIETWTETSEIFAQNLRPVKYTPKGWPVYAQEEIDKLLEELKVRLPEEF